MHFCVINQKKNLVSILFCKHPYLHTTYTTLECTLTIRKALEIKRLKLYKIVSAISVVCVFGFQPEK